jgi:putative heme iron utilization protein
VYWLTAEAIAAPPNTIHPSETDLLAYANSNHAQDVHDCCRHMLAIGPREVRVVGIDCDGFDARADDTLVRFEFADTAHDAESARSAFIALVRGDRH